LEFDKLFENEIKKNAERVIDRKIIFFNFIDTPLDNKIIFNC
jgi:hypothetical protein